MLFRQICGHTEIKQKLISTIKDERISHAQLFAGPEGNGKLALAIAYAQFLSCSDRQEDDSCGKCNSCIKYNKLVHPDLHFVFPVVSIKTNTKPVSDDFLVHWREYILGKPYYSFDEWVDKINLEKKQAGIFAHESNEIIRKLNLKTFQAEYKVMVIWMPEKMNVSASNKLLKVLEEPPPKTLFLLVSDNPDTIIQTVLSRTQMLKIPKISRTDMKETLLKDFSLPEEKAQEIVRLSAGNFNRAYHLIDFGTDDESEFFPEFTELMRNAYVANIENLIAWSENISQKGREKQKLFLNYSLRMLRENFILNVSRENKEHLSFLANKELEFSEKFSTFINKNNIYELNQEFNTALHHIERNGYDRIILLDLALKTTKLLRKNNDN